MTCLTSVAAPPRQRPPPRPRQATAQGPAIPSTRSVALSQPSGLSRLGASSCAPTEGRRVGPAKPRLRPQAACETRDDQLRAATSAVTTQEERRPINNHTKTYSKKKARPRQPCAPGTTPRGPRSAAAPRGPHWAPRRTNLKPRASTLVKAAASGGAPSSHYVACTSPWPSP